MLIIYIYIYTNNNKGGQNLLISGIFIYFSMSYVVDKAVDKLWIKCGKLFGWLLSTGLSTGLSTENGTLKMGEIVL